MEKKEITTKKMVEIHSKYTSYITATAIILGGIFAGLLSFSAQIKKFSEMTIELWILFIIALVVIIIGICFLIKWKKEIQKPLVGLVEMETEDKS